ncbi:MAG: putative F0F1-ATPase subunit Ca2+/Mg2+ transporter [Candidatus Electronema aureum]|uniref:F0F1-ATPase subunit Ca2+/Mg2+ transporter n=1 Tax=Candidatus Electronema aureum TaxID=2005002 RepID=A0A521G071_9BACT|nr:MAG: putative F0F1-ATPase subunit Ca2+/Mg2+ transporter [Candidatus Electronema aureum]
MHLPRRRAIKLTQSNRERKEEKGILSDLANYSQSGMTFALSVVIGFGMGWYLDNKVFGGRTTPWLSFIFLGFGILAGFKHLWDLSQRIAKDDD